MENAGKTKKVAVIAVHGVGDQAPFETAHRIGDLLQDLNVGQKPCQDTPPAGPQAPVYYPFHEESIRLDVRPTIVQRPAQSEEVQESPKKEARGPFNTWVKDRLKSSQKTVSGDSLDEDVWYQFTKGQLSGYRGDEPENTYQTLRMEGRRAPQDDKPAIDVHVYELYWADLSRLKAGMLSIFTELYQLLFHLPSLGVHTVNAAVLNHPTRDWRIFRTLQAMTAGILTIPIPILNLLMFGMVMMAVASNALKNAPAALVLSAAGLGVVLIGGLGGVLWGLLAKKDLKPWIWLSPLALIVVFAAGASYGATKVEGWNYAWQIVASCIVALVAGLLSLWILAIYDRRRPGALKWTGILALAVLAAGVSSLFSPWPPPGHQSVVTFWVRLFEVCDIALLFAWGGFFLLGLATSVIGGIAVFRTPKADKLARSSRWTGMLMLSLPALAFLIVTVTLWYAVATSTAKLLPHTPYNPLWRLLFPVDSVECLIALVQCRLGTALQFLLFAAGISLIPAVWGLAPVVWTEVFPVKSTQRSRGPDSRRLGRWLTLAFQGLFLSGSILYIATMFFLPLRFSLSVFGTWEPLGASVVSGTGLLGLFLVRGRLKKLALGFRPVLDILLDVDNWFREHPLDSNPKARICGRYVSLLRYICNWREDSADANTGYDGIVIIAHSQGTVITADLLRFLKKESRGSMRDYDPELQNLCPSQEPSDSGKTIPIYFFTMGSPLRQLYGLRFPHLYRWARHTDEKPMTPWKKGDIPKDQLPDPSDLLGVTLWVNCYRSGDYVGRFLWRTDQCDYMWTGDCHAHHPAKAIEYSCSTDEVKRLEFCIGAGAHTHYWDRHARIVATELDLLIAAL
jgi:hypothetical protein